MIKTIPPWVHGSKVVVVAGMGWRAALSHLDESKMLDQLRNLVKAVFGIQVWTDLNAEPQPDVVSFRAEEGV